jgi:hypothetical protein
VVDLVDDLLEPQFVGCNENEIVSYPHIKAKSSMLQKKRKL